MRIPDLLWLDCYTYVFQPLPSLRALDGMGSLMVSNSTVENHAYCVELTYFWYN